MRFLQGELASEQPRTSSSEAKAEVAQSRTGLSALGQLRRERFARFLELQLSAIGGLWLGTVPVSLLASVDPVGGPFGALVFSGLLYGSLHFYLFRTELRSYGMRLTSRSSGRVIFLNLSSSSAAQSELRSDRSRLKQKLLQGQFPR